MLASLALADVVPTMPEAARVGKHEQSRESQESQKLIANSR
jgi:hypothetical protein